MAFHLTNKAKTDLKNIARYTQQEWGINQRNRYLNVIDQAFKDLAEKPKTGRSCDYIKLGYRKLKVGKHLIFYRNIDSTNIEIVRILHERMDIQQHF